MTRSRFALWALGAFLPGAILTPSASGQGAPLRVLCGNGIRGAMEQLTPEAEKTIGRKLSIEFSVATLIEKEIDGGAAFDLAILTPAIIENLAKSGKIVAGSQTTLASADLGVGMKAGARKTDVSTPDGMKKRLLAAKTITWTEGGASNGATRAMIKGLGIENELKPKIVLQTVAGRAAESVASGVNELLFAPVSEIKRMQGVEVLGLFPQAYQQPVVLTAAIATQSKDADADKALVRFLAGAKAVPALKAAGMNPGSASR